MNRQLFGFICFFALSIGAQAEVSGKLGLTSNYVWRGISQSNMGISVQGDLRWDHLSGFYAGAFVNTTALDPKPSTPLSYDLYAGWLANLGPIGIGIGLIDYNYRSKKDDFPNSREYSLGLSWRSLRTAGFYNEDTKSQYYEVANDWDLGDSMGLTLGYGHTAPEQGDVRRDIQIAFGRSVGELDAEIKLTYADENYDKYHIVFSAFRRF